MTAQSAWLGGGAVATMTAHLAMASGDAVLQQKQAVAWLGRTVGPWQLRAVVGGQWDGAFTAGSQTFSLRPGWLVGVAVGRNLLAQNVFLPYLAGSAALAVASAAGPGDHSLTATDLRLGCDAGWLLLDRIDVHAVGRLFGGPVWWRGGGATDLGGDRWHVQLGAGLGLRVAGGLALFAEAIALGETGASAGVAARW